MIYICIPVLNRLELTVNCINSIKNQTYKNFKIVICEHSNDFRTFTELKNRFPELILLKGDESMWWTAATNTCIKYVLEKSDDQDYVFTLNNDTELEQNCLLTLADYIRDYPDSIFGCVNLLYDEKNKVEPSAQIERNIFGFHFYRNLNNWRDDISNFSGLHEVEALSGKGVLVPVKIYKDIGLYNEQMLPHYHADTEFIIRASNNGYSVYLAYKAKLYSNYQETGHTSRSPMMTYQEFIKSFWDIKSTRHFVTLRNKAKLIYGKKYPVYLLIKLVNIIGGFVKRRLFR